MQSVPPPAAAAAATADASRGDDGAATTPLDGEKSHREDEQELDIDMNELFGSSDSDDDGGDGRDERREERREEQRVEQREEPLKSSSVRHHHPPPEMRIPTSLHDALPPSRNRLAKLPASVRIVQEAFREEGFEGDDREGVDVRWRYALDEKGGKALVRESNARVVTWSDGSQTLHVGGNAAVYNVKAIDIDKDETFLYANVQRLIQVRCVAALGCPDDLRRHWGRRKSPGTRHSALVTRPSGHRTPRRSSSTAERLHRLVGDSQRDGHLLGLRQ